MKSEVGSAAECHSRAFPAGKDLVLGDAAPTATASHTCLFPIPLPSVPPGSVQI